MHFFKTLLSLTLLLAGAQAAKKSSAERFDDFHAKSQRSTPVKLKEPSYKTLTTAPRDYTVAVLLTALETRFGCQLCQEFQPEYELLAQSWTKGDKSGESRLIFGTLDFVDGREVFVTVFSQLGLQTAPVLLLFPPTEGPHAVASKDPLRFDFNTGGHMFNHIRKVPYVSGDGRGGVTYFSGNFQSQLGMETQIVAAIYGLLAFCSIALIVKVPRIADSGTQQVAVIAWSVILFSMYSFMLSIFRIKNSGYPFSLPPFM
ncbi:oligosaccharyltransferase complex subunit gamma [Geosmithia morbida]|uniref:Oligosaccharyltransferase complex subunit gamma n=1 Tax=Geosmithia morbida TaxID=1094350 RepID=A0A9P4YSN9_9HYPO|nr:oligosaccharyltransferase complex subunit gamma [Geosmithia morbida]KAF4121003.1 oligosaccharyltransferase complex subunit gamma [Geosmithia morbida]